MYPKGDLATRCASGLTIRQSLHLTLPRRDKSRLECTGRLKGRGGVARAGCETGEPTHAGEPHKGRRESALDLRPGGMPRAEWPAARAGAANVRPQWVPGGQRGPRGDPVCLWGAGFWLPTSGGGLAGLGPREPQPQGGSYGAGQAAHLPAGHSGPQQGSPPRSLPATQPARPRCWVSEGPTPSASAPASPQARTGGPALQSQSPCGRDVGQQLPPARARPREQPPPSRSEGDKGPGWALLYLRNQREQRLLHRASFDLES